MVRKSKKEKVKEKLQKLRKQGKKNLKKAKAIGKEEIDKIKNEAEQVKEKILNVPNAITLLRILATPILVYVLLGDFNKYFQAATFVVFALSDALDGFIARNFNQKTRFGAKFDMLADRIFFSTVLIVLAIRLFALPNAFISSPYLILLLLCREIIGLPMFIYMLLRGKKTFFPAKISGKLTTLMQGVAIGAILIDLPYVIIPMIITGISGIWAGLTYWRDSFEFLKKRKRKN